MRDYERTIRTRYTNTLIEKSNMYHYRKLTPEQKTEAVQQRQLRGMPNHRPPRFGNTSGWFLITASTFEHKPYFNTDEDRTRLFNEIQKELVDVEILISGWSILGNHYHLLVECNPLSSISQPIRRVHARSARELNRRDEVSGRKVWHLFSDRHIRNERHYYTTLNYIHYNATKHDYVEKPSNWMCSSLHWYEEHFGIEWLRDLWRKYPVRNYGKGWDWI